MTHLNRDMQIQRFIDRLNGDPSAARQLRDDPIASVHAAGFDLDLDQPVSLYMAGIPTCLDPPETNHYRNK